MKKSIILIFIFSLFLIFSFSSCKNSGNKNIADIFNDTTLTIEDLTKEIRNNPKNADLFVKRSELYLKENNLKEAIRDLEVALKVDSTRQDIYIKLSDLYLQKGNSKSANEVLKKCLTYYPANVEARIKLAYLYFYIQLYREAMQEIIVLERNNLQNGESYFLKALILNETEAYEDAAIALKKALEYNKNNDQAYILLGLVYTKLKDPIALEYFNTAASLFPDNAEVFFNRGYALQEFGKYIETEQSYLKATELDTAYYEAFYNLGYIYANFLNKNEEALKYFSRAIELRPNSEKAIYSRGFVYEKMGKYKLAEMDYRKVLEIHPNYDLAVEGLNEVIKKQQ